MKNLNLLNILLVRHTTRSFKRRYIPTVRLRDFTVNTLVQKTFSFLQDTHDKSYYLFNFIRYLNRMYDNKGSNNIPPTIVRHEHFKNQSCPSTISERKKMWLKNWKCRGFISELNIANSIFCMPAVTITWIEKKKNRISQIIYNCILSLQ